MSPGAVDVVLIRRHLMALDAALQTLRWHAGRALAELSGPAGQPAVRVILLRCDRVVRP